MQAWLVVSAAAFFLNLFGVNWDAVDARIASNYPEVSTIEVHALANRLASGAQEGLTLVDVREAEEFQVSHLESARNLGDAAAIAAAFPDPDTELILYCSVGYRSAAVAQELHELGYSNVLNLRHSLFAWANSGLPMMNASGLTTKAHPNNRIWGILLHKDHHQYSH